MKRIFGLILLGLCGVGCDDSTDEESTTSAPLSVEIWGETFIEEGIPVAAFADSYSILFDTFLVAVSDIAAAQNAADVPAFNAPQQKIWDLTLGGPHPIETQTVGVGAYQNTAYSIRPAVSTAVSGNADAADVQFMKSNGYSVYVSGRGTKGNEAWTFAWGFKTATAYGPCHSTGQVSEANGGRIQLTIHGDHFFYDSAVSENPSLRFEDLQLADANGDGDITPGELSQYTLLPLTHYRTNDSEIENMWQYLAHMATTLGHIDGEGHCETE